VRAIRSVIAVFLPLAVTVAGAVTAPAALAAPAQPKAQAPGERRVCPVSRHPGWLDCQAVYELGGQGSLAPAFVSNAATPGGFGPSALRSAYNLTHDSLTRGWHKTVAVVDAYRDPDAASDLASYRRHYHLAACTRASGCLRIVNQAGQAGPLPAVSGAWGVEESLDLDMISAICPHCRLLLVEASSASPGSLGRAEDTAVALGARFVSDSWSGTEARGQSVYNHYFNHPGVAIVVASGDGGYGTSYPADLQYVTAVGGTQLVRRRSGSRAWTETVWGSGAGGVQGTGSGCSARTAKPSWQREPVDIGPGGCQNRTQNDVAAVADPATGVAVYDTYRTQGTWATVGGTSAATPVIAAVYALAGDPAPRSYPASYLYQHAGHFHDVTVGADGKCPTASSYLCQAKPGYDGPTGLGTPLGVGGFSSRGTDPVTLVDPGPQRAPRGAFRLTVTGLDVRAALALSYSATGLPPGLTVRSLRGTTNGLVSGTIGATVASGTTFRVVVTATDRTTGRSNTTRFTIVVR
jgi:hypothetical protein